MDKDVLRGKYEKDEYEKISNLNNLKISLNDIN